jgi:hypothetical protein
MVLINKGLRTNSQYFVFVGAAVGMASIPIDRDSGGNASQSSMLRDVVRRALKQDPVTSWPSVENKVYSLSQPRKVVRFFHFNPV